MTMYYAVPVRRDHRTLTYNPADGHCALAGSMYDIHVQLGVPGPGEMFAVWPLTRNVSLEEAARVCSLMAPLRIYIALTHEVVLPLASAVVQEAVMEGSGADGN